MDLNSSSLLQEFRYWRSRFNKVLLYFFTKQSCLKFHGIDLGMDVTERQRVHGSIQTTLDDTRPFGTILDHVGLFEIIPDCFRPFWDVSGPFWTCEDPCGTFADHFGTLLILLDHSGLIWNISNILRPFWDHFSSFWDYSVPLRIISDYFSIIHYHKELSTILEIKKYPP